MKEYYVNYDYVFVSNDVPETDWHASVSRADYLSLPIPMIPEEMSDDQMQEIADNIAVHMWQEYDASELTLYNWYLTEGPEEMSNEQINRADKMSEREFELFELEATRVGMRYWEDLDNEEFDLVEKEINEANRKAGQ